MAFSRVGQIAPDGLRCSKAPDDELHNPTVVIVDDRIDLETQITSTFNASDIPNLASAKSKDELVTFFKNDTRKILITTIFKFGEVDCALNLRDNIILMVDEAQDSGG